MREFLSLQALWRVELHLEAKSRLRSAPLSVDPLVLAARPEVLELYLFETVCLEPFDVCADPFSVAIRTVRERVSHCVGHLIQRLTWRQMRFHQQDVGDLLLKSVHLLKHVLQAD